MAARQADVEPWIDTVNRALDGVDAKIALHICFGNLNNKPFNAPRTYSHLLPHLGRVRAGQLVLEFGNRELGEIERMAGLVADKELGFGCVDVKAFRVEPPEAVAERIRTALKHVPAERLYVNPDCGFWDTPRWICRRKLASMVEGARIVRAELEGRG